MEKSSLIIFLLWFTASVQTAVADENSEAIEEKLAQSRAAVMDFGNTLKGHLQQAIKAGGPTQAIEVCNLKAPQVAADMAAAKGWEIGRTSLKLRNTDNAPDAWERSTLEEFEARKNQGEDPQKLEFYEVVEQDGSRAFRYMKAIPTGEVCLNCHGAEITPEIAAKLDELYPQDQARGFSVGDLRGAFTITQPL